MSNTIADVIRQHAVPIDPDTAVARLLEAIAPDQSLVLIGEATHGTRRPAKVVVWAHNSHLGDARATSMAEGGELNLAN